MDYFDLNLNIRDEDSLLRSYSQKFAMEVMRPVAKKLDRMSAEEAVAPDSPFWDFMKQAYQLGYHKMLIPEAYGGVGLSPLQISLIFEELAWGSFGLALHLAVASFPFFMACMSGKSSLIEKYVKPFCECDDGSIIGCWGITEPNHGSDVVNTGEAFFHKPDVRGDVTARLEGDHWIVNGQKSSWVSGGTVATHALLHLQVDPSMGLAGSAIFFCPLDLDGISKGKALEKLGQRDLNQGEIFFDNVKIPKEYLLAEPDFYIPMLDMILSSANLCMSAWSVGLARAAFDEALEHCRNRVQGGVPLIQHYNIRQRIFEMFANVETARAVSRAAINLNFNIQPPHVEYSILAKTRCTSLAYKNSDEAIQLLGGYGLTKEYLIEKLYRDARTSLIEDGNNETLSAHGGEILANTYPRIYSDF